MPASVVVDSCFYIDRLRAGIDPFKELATYADTWEFATCGVVTLEVLRGVKHKASHDRMQQLFSSMIYIPTTNPIWEGAAALAWQLDRLGRPMQVTDLLIAASALHSEAVLLTFDRDFNAVPGLRVLCRLS